MIDDRYNKWSRDGVLSFIPPDGKFKLMEYEGGGKTAVPVGVKAGLTQDASGGQSLLTRPSPFWVNQLTYRPVLVNIVFEN